MSVDIVNVASRRESFANTAIAGTIPLTNEQRKLARELGNAKRYRKTIQVKSDMRELIDSIVMLKRSEGLDDGVAIRVAVALLEMQESLAGNLMFRLS